MEFRFFPALLFSKGSGVNGLELEKPMTIKRFFEEYWWVCIILLLVVVTIAMGLTYIKQNSKAKKRTIHFVGGDEISVSYGSRPVLPIPQNQGYIFRGWFLDSACTIPFDSRKPVKKDLILYPKWEKEVG